MTVWFDEKRNKWKYNFRYNRQRYARYCDDPDTGLHAKNKTDAARIEDIIRGNIKRINMENKQTTGGYTFAEALAYYWKHKGSICKNREDVKLHIKEVGKFFGGNTLVKDIKKPDITNYIAFSRDQKIMVNIGGPGRPPVFRTNKDGRTRSDSRTNRYLTTLRAALRLAVEDEKVRYCCKVIKLEEPKELPNPISQEEISRLIKVAAPHLKYVILLCVYTGMRESECLGLKWSNVRLSSRRITLGSDTKSKKGRVIPLTDQAITALKTIKGNLEKLPDPDEHVILYKGNPIKSVDTAWATARDAANLERHYTFHNTRDSAASFLLNSSGDLRTVQKFLGHKNIKTTMRYADAEDAKMEEAVAKLGETIHLDIPLEVHPKGTPKGTVDETTIR